MINLLPYNKKSNIAAARANSALIKYIFILLGSFVFISASTMVVYTINQSIIDNLDKSNSNQNKSSSGNEIDTYNSYKKELEYFSQNVYPNTLNYSDILQKLASKLPNGVIIEEINISSSTIKGDIDVTLYGTSVQSLNLAKNNFPNMIVNDSLMPAAKFNNYTYSANLKINLERDLR